MTVPDEVSVPHEGDSRSAGVLLLTTGLSLAGNAIVAVVIPWLVLTRTASPGTASLVAAASLTALVGSSVLGGALIDRWGRRRMSVLADVLSAAAVAAVPLADHFDRLSIWLLVTLVALGALFDGPGSAAREAMRPAIARQSGWGLDRLTARSEAIEGVSAIAGPAAAGLAILTLGATHALWLTVLMFLTSAFFTHQCLPPGKSATTTEPYWRATKQGLAMIRHDPALRAIAITGSLLVAVLAPLEAVILPAWFAEQHNPLGLTVVLVAFAAGGIAGALHGPTLIARHGQHTTLTAALAALTIGILAMATLPTVPPLAVIATLTGYGAGPIGPILSIKTQERTPETARARVLGTLTALSLASAPAGLLMASPLLQHLSYRGTLTTAALGCLAATIHTHHTRHTRTLDATNSATALLQPGIAPAQSPKTPASHSIQQPPDPPPRLSGAVHNRRARSTPEHPHDGSTPPPATSGPEQQS